MTSRYECKLSPESLKKAVAELNEPEDNDIRLAAIDKLRTRFEEEIEDFELIRTDDAFLLRFLRVRKFDQDRALKTLENYHRHRKEWRELFDLVDNPKAVEDVLSRGPIIPLSKRANDGTFVVIGRPGLCMTGDDIIKFMAILLLSMEKLLEKEEVQIHGLTVIEDMADHGLVLALQMTQYAKRFMPIIQNAMPIRVKSLNMVNESLVFDAMYMVIKQFMKEKMKKRLQLHGSEFTKLHEKVDPSGLPPFLGGTGPNLDAEAWKKEITSTVGVGEATSL